MIRTLAATTVALVAYVTTQHPLAFVALAVCAAVLAWVGLRDEPEELAPYRYPGGDR